MQGELSLEGIAEISIALAGFSGLIAMLRSGPVYEWHPRVRLAFWISLNWSISAVVFSALPSLLLLFGGIDWSSLTLAIGLFLTFGLVAMLWVHFGLARRGSPTQNPWHWLATVTVGLVGSFGTLGSVLGIFGPSSYASYRFGVLSCLLLAIPGFLASLRVRGSEPDA